MATSEKLYHLVLDDVWQACKVEQRPYYPSTYEQDGFIHLTKEPLVLLSVANHFYTDVPGQYIVLGIDPSKLTDKVVFEPAAPVGTKPAHASNSQDEEPVLFPHLYGTINFDSVVEELAVDRDEAGRFLKIHGAAFQ